MLSLLALAYFTSMVVLFSASDRILDRLSATLEKLELWDNFQARLNLSFVMILMFAMGIVFGTIVYSIILYTVVKGL